MGKHDTDVDDKSYMDVSTIFINSKVYDSLDDVFLSDDDLKQRFVLRYNTQKNLCMVPETSLVDTSNSAIIDKRHWSTDTLQRQITPADILERRRSTVSNDQKQLINAYISMTQLELSS